VPAAAGRRVGGPDPQGARSDRPGGGRRPRGGGRAGPAGPPRGAADDPAVRRGRPVRPGGGRRVLGRPGGGPAEFPHLLRLVKASALLHFRQRERDAAGRVVAARADYVLAVRLAARPAPRRRGRGLDARPGVPRPAPGAVRRPRVHHHGRPGRRGRQEADGVRLGRGTRGRGGDRADGSPPREDPGDVAADRPRPGRRRGRAAGGRGVPGGPAARTAHPAEVDAGRGLGASGAELHATARSHGTGGRCAACVSCADHPMHAAGAEPAWAYVTRACVPRGSR